MRTKIDESYNNFINTINNNIVFYTKEYYKDLSVALAYYDIIEYHIDNKEYLKEFQENTVLTISKTFICKMQTLYKSHSLLSDVLNKFYITAFRTIPYKYEKIQLFKILSLIDYSSYSEVIFQYNFCMMDQVLLGEKVRLRNIGLLYITNKEIINKKVRLDFAETNKMKRKYQDENIDKDYRVYRNATDYTSFVLLKRCNLKNLQYYSFVPTNYFNIGDRCISDYYKTKPSLDEILNNTKMGNVQKMNCLINADYKYKAKYIENGNNVY